MAADWWWNLRRPHPFNLFKAPEWAFWSISRLSCQTSAQEEPNG